MTFKFREFELRKAAELRDDEACEIHGNKPELNRSMADYGFERLKATGGRSRLWDPTRWWCQLMGGFCGGEPGTATCVACSKTCG